jgi:hypothetical protein
MNTVKFRAPGDYPLPVSLTSGHTMVVPATPEGVEVPQMFQREAMARGAVLAEGGPAEVKTQILSRQLAIREALQAMAEGGNKDDLTGDGKPNLVRLKAITGFQVSREEADQVFAQVKSGAQA